MTNHRHDTCPKCGGNEFYFSPRTCKPCKQKANARYKAKQKGESMEPIQCTKCSVYRDKSEFYSERMKKQVRTCRNCREKAMLRHHAGPKKVEYVEPEIERIYQLSTEPMAFWGKA